MPQRKATRIWLTAAVATAAVLGAIFYTQSTFIASGDLSDACLAVGQELDLNYRLRHPRDGSAVFPLHNRCNAVSDLVPDWVNPTLSLIAAMLSLALVGLLFSRIRKHA
jgi:hypothetical protein